MRSYPIRIAFGLPMVSAVVVGPKGASRVFDSGAANTQLHIGTLKLVGLSFDKRTPDITVRGVAGSQSGYSCNVERLHILGKKKEQIEIAAFDFSDWAEDGIDGLLGWDLIQELHFDMNGPKGILKVF